MKYTAIPIIIILALFFLNEKNNYPKNKSLILKISNLKEEDVEINQTKNLKWKNLFENELIGLNSGENDKSGMFSIFKDVIVGDKFTELSKEYDVSLVSFASLDKLYWIPIVLRYI